MGVKKEGSLTSLRKDLASRWLSRPLCLLEDDGPILSVLKHTAHQLTHTQDNLPLAKVSHSSSK